MSGVSRTSVCTSAPLDLVFLIDGSGSICDSDPLFYYGYNSTCNNWLYVVQFLDAFVDSLTVGPTETRVGLILFASKADIRWNLNT